MTASIVSRARPVVLIVDDIAANRELLEALLVEFGYEVRHAGDGIEALAAVRDDEPDLILLDVRMPRMDGIALCRVLKSDPRLRLIPVVLVTAAEDTKTRLEGIAAGADDFVSKPFQAETLVARVRMLLHARAFTRKLDDSAELIVGLARIIEARDLYTVHHAERVGRYAREIGRAHGIADVEALEVLYRGGVLHDLGKVAVPAEILLKRGPLSPGEMMLMQEHAAEGQRLCRPLRSMQEYLPIVRHHHERWDGRGYPDRLQRVEIPLGARLVAVADAWDAMTSDRPYRAALEPEEATRRLRDGAGRQWDPDFVDIFVHLLEEGAVAHVASEVRSPAN